MKLMYIEWCDAIANANWFLKDEALRWIEESEWVVRETGWLLKETKEYIFLASTWKTEDTNTDEQFKNLHKIPKTWVRRRIDLSKSLKEKK